MTDIVLSTKSSTCVQSVFSYLPRYLALFPLQMHKTEVLDNPSPRSDKPKMWLATVYIISHCLARASARMFALADGCKWQ